LALRPASERVRIYYLIHTWMSTLAEVGDRAYAPVNRNRPGSGKIG
jgi:hypothetical protein